MNAATDEFRALASNTLSLCTFQGKLIAVNRLRTWALENKEPLIASGLMKSFISALNEAQK